MAHYRVFDEESARLLSARTSPSDHIDQLRSGEYFAANPGDVILAPSIKLGEVLYIRIKSATPVPVPATDPVTSAQVSAEPQHKVHYVATGFLGLEGDLEEETPEPPKPWWKKMFVD